MKSRFTILLILLVLFAQSAMAQWEQQPDFPGLARSRSASFTVGGKMYVMGGLSNNFTDLNDFWEYDISDGVWTQKPGFPGGARYGAVAFAIGTNGYIACGSQDGPNFGDLWQYNTVTEAWTQKATVPERRREGFAFVIDGKAYVGGGVVSVAGPNSTWNAAMADLWQYDPATDAWTPKAGFPDFIGRQMCITGVINGKGYVGLGTDADEEVNYKGFWEYNPASDSWTAKADFPNDFTTDAASFVYKSELYVIGGVTLPQVGFTQQTYKYNADTAIWVSVGAFDGGPVAGAITGGNDTVAILGTGFTSALQTRKDIWTFATATVIDTVPNPNHIAGVKGSGLNMTVIYPNPASSQITVQTGAAIAGIAVYDMAGRLLISQPGDKKSISIAHLSNGVYSVRVSYRDGTSGVGGLCEANNKKIEYNNLHRVTGD